MANNSGVEVNGTEQILNNLEKLGVNIKKATDKALNNSADIVVKELEKNSPYDPNGKIHMKEHVVKSRVKTDSETGGKYIAIGYPKGIKHRVHINEFGTINQAPQHFMADTLKNTKQAVRNEIMNTLKGAIT